MTATEHTALYKFTFQPGSNVSYRNPMAPEQLVLPSSPLILIDLVDIGSSRQAGGVQIYEDSGRIIGDAIFNPSFGTGAYQAFFCADIIGDEIRDTGIFEGEDAYLYPKYLSNLGSGFSNPTGAAGAWIQFEPPKSNQILARIGISFMSVDQACSNAEREIPDFDFEDVVRAAEDAWAEKLSAIQLDATGVSEELQTVFWSGVYRSLLSPQNYTGENPLWNSTEPYFDSFYCIWDSFRAQHPLITIIDPDAQIQMIRSLLDIYRFEGAPLHSFQRAVRLLDFDIVDTGFRKTPGLSHEFLQGLHSGT
jgi:putative alpha-1,2-mannosidase